MPENEGEDQKVNNPKPGDQEADESQEIPVPDEGGKDVPGGNQTGTDIPGEDVPEGNETGKDIPQEYDPGEDSPEENEADKEKPKEL